MVKKRGFKLGVMALLGVFLLGATVSAGPAVAGTVDDNSGKAVMKGRQHFKAPKRGEFLNYLEDLAGLGVDDVKAQLKDGKTMAEILEAAGVTQEELQDKMKEQQEARLKELLDNGKIDQEKYDKLMSREFKPGEFGKVRGIRGADRGAGLEKKLENGTISQEQYDAIMAVHDAVKDKIADLKDELKDMDPADRQDKITEVRRAALQELLDNGTISQEMYDKMISHTGQNYKDKSKPGLMGQGFKHKNTPGKHRMGAFSPGCSNQE